MNGTVSCGDVCVCVEVMEGVTADLKEIDRHTSRPLICT